MRILGALRASAIVLVGALGAVSSQPAKSGGFADVLQTPALKSPLASRSLLQGVAQVGNRLIAVGQRGHIVVSTDGGKTWTQSSVPVSADLTAVYFVDDRSGWAVGHDGVVLHSSDGGDSWEVQLTGHAANDLLLASMERRIPAEPASENAKALLAEAKRHKEQGADKPFLDVWFADANSGFVVGAYNLIFHTVDGGKTWETWFDRTENPKFFNLYAIRPVGGELYIAGEGGLLLKRDSATQRFKAVAIPYNGSLFGIAKAGSAAIVFGLRGVVYRSDDAGASWTKVDAGLASAVVAAARGAGGGMLLADAGGRVAVTDDGGRSFRPVAMKQAVPLTGLADLGGGRVVLVGPRGASLSESSPR